MIDWEAVKKEYISGGVSYRKLCDKYNVPLSTLRRRSAKEHWVELKAQVEEKANTDAIKKLGEAKARCGKAVVSIADKLLTRLESAVDRFPVSVSMMTIQQATSALKALKDIVDHKSELDIAEQRARIRKLEADCKKIAEEDAVQVIKVEFEQKEWSE